MPKDPPSHVVIYDYYDNNFVVLAQLPTPVPTTKKKPALFRHKKGRNPAIEAVLLSKTVVKQKPQTVLA